MTNQAYFSFFDLVSKIVEQEQHGSTALILAAQHGRPDCLRLLLQAGADTDAVKADWVRTRLNRVFLGCILFSFLFLAFPIVTGSVTLLDSILAG